MGSRSPNFKGLAWNLESNHGRHKYLKRDILGIFWHSETDKDGKRRVLAMY